MKKILSLFSILFSLQNSSFSQNQHLIDTLETQLKNHNTLKLELNLSSPSLYDTTAAKLLSRLAVEYRGNNPDKAMEYAQQSLALSEQIGYKKGMAIAYINLGISSEMKGDFLPALDYNKKALDIGLETNDKRNMAYAYNTIGVIYYNQSNYPEALKNYLASLKIKEEIGDKPGIANAYGNLGNIYSSQGNYPEALKSYTASLKMHEEIDNKYGIGDNYNNIGATYHDLRNYPEALKNYFLALQIRQEIKDVRGIADSYHAIGESYLSEGNYPEALKNQFAALKIQEEIDDQYSIAFTCIAIGDSYFGQGKYTDAYAYYNKALSLAKELGGLDLVASSYSGLAIVDSARGNFMKAFEHYKLYITYRDSIINTEKTEQIVALQMNYDFSKKQDSLNVVQAKKDLAAQKELNKNKLIRNTFIAGTMIFLLFAGAAILFYIDRMQRNRKKQLEEVRARISRDLHDDMGSTLQSISVMSEIVRMKSTSDNRQESIPFIEKIGSASREMVDKMNDIVWAVNPQNDDFENIILHMRAFGGELLAGKDIALHFKANGSLNDIRLSMEKRRSFFLVYKEALNNAYKYSCAKNVNVEISRTHHTLTLVVEDDGAGFNMNEERLITGGNGLKNMSTRAAELNGTISITSETGHGTKVSLTVNLS
ncbi:MAG: tetratricopeptide repeat protein [Saprospiraceae bacterium]|uniref:Tetratricopeptide repeat protein n=1 Tax=Candidatus Opimibacter skivensis TaxID=2982028 RepID=A0A9D7SRZ7_9BACT|nr:tetratricopeptide repeat protein [Candidatus Opimibacter skivensis]